MYLRVLKFICRGGSSHCRALASTRRYRCCGCAPPAQPNLPAIPVAAVSQQPINSSHALAQAANTSESATRHTESVAARSYSLANAQCSQPGTAARLKALRIISVIVEHHVGEILPHPGDAHLVDEHIKRQVGALDNIHCIYEHILPVRRYVHARVSNAGLSYGEGGKRETRVEVAHHTLGLEHIALFVERYCPNVIRARALGEKIVGEKNVQLADHIHLQPVDRLVLVIYLRAEGAFDNTIHVPRQRNDHASVVMLDLDLLAP
ncbi:hypothetical protein HMPREF9069_00312 [Atopobium sp. oral taxon 810 str. F0209]|nr:hypothetical protein HMPREF9069_00312 [Atopobium sp. oral taxon 810 str. F0209]